MGKKYEAYKKAVKANNVAKLKVAEAQGGSTLSHLEEAYTNAEQARMIEEDAWGQVQMDPEG